MNAVKRHLGLLLGGVLVVTGIWACTATRHPDGTVEVGFAPDMAIRAKGLENALKGLGDLLESCVSGTFPRPCTDSEIEDIVEAMERVLRRKEKVADSPTPSGPAGIG